MGKVTHIEKYPDGLKLSWSTLAKLGSAIVHFEEHAETGQPPDLDAAKALLHEPDVLEVIGTLRGLALLPLKRPK